MQQPAIIELEKIAVAFNGFKALTGVDFSLQRGELRMLIGPNGAGKTTLLDVISGKVRPESGRIVFKGENICGLKEHRIAGLGISRKFQTPSIFGNLTVFENMELSLVKAKGIFPALASRLTCDDTDKIVSMLRLIGLEDKIQTRAGILSHGEKQWLELGMSIIQGPALLLVDEPVAGMTGKEREKTGELLRTISEDLSVLVVEHDMEFVRRIAKKVTVLHEGMILCEGTMEEVQNNPAVIDVYLGRTEEG
jgi:urea transport system ATP-binding protein